MFLFDSIFSVGVMSVKKKLQRIRKAKEAKLDLQAQTENTQNEEIYDKQYKKKEVMQTLICEFNIFKASIFYKILD